MRQTVDAMCREIVGMGFRISYGNGQVENLTKCGEKEARKRFRAVIEADVRKGQPYSHLYRLQRYIGDGEWETLSK